MYVYYRARDMFVKLSLMSWMDIYVLYLLLMLLYALVKVLEDPLTDFMCLVFTADATVRAGKGPGGSSVQNKFELLNILKVCIYAKKANQVIFELAQSLGTEMEVYDAELWAIDRASQYAVSHLLDGPTKDVWIFADNQAAIQRLQSLKPGHGQHHAYSVWEQAATIQERGATLHIHWVPGHRDVEGNEEADKRAKEAAKKADRRSPNLSLSYLKRRVKEMVTEEWNIAWRHLNHGKSYRGSPQANINKIMAQLPKQVISAITQLKTGHGFFNSYLAKIPNSGVISTKCSCSPARQTPEHLLLNCKLYKSERRQLKKDLGKFPLMTAMVLHTSIGLKALITFLTTTKIATRHGRTDEQGSRSGTGWGRLEE